MSASVNACITGFNKTLDELIDYLCAKFPRDADLSYTKSMIKMAKSAGPRVALKEFMQYVDPYKEQVMHHNEMFFLSLVDHSEHADKLKGLQLKDKWATFNDQEKADIWKFFEKLVRFGDIVVKAF